MGEPSSSFFQTAEGLLEWTRCVQLNLVITWRLPDWLCYRICWIGSVLQVTRTTTCTEYRVWRVQTRHCKSYQRIQTLGVCENTNWPALSPNRLKNWLAMVRRRSCISNVFAQRGKQETEHDGKHGWTLSDITRPIHAVTQVWPLAKSLLSTDNGLRRGWDPAQLFCRSGYYKYCSSHSFAVRMLVLVYELWSEFNLPTARQVLKALFMHQLSELVENREAIQL